MKQLFRCIVFVLMICMLVIFSGCSSIDSKDINTVFTTRDVSTTERAIPGAFVPYNEGLIFSNDCVVKILDFVSGKSRALCPNANCRHSDDSCVAWVGGFAGGYAAFCNGYYYYVVDDYEEGNLKLVSLSSDSYKQKTLLSLNAYEYSEGEKIYEIKSVTYLKNNIAVIECLEGTIPRQQSPDKSGTIDYVQTVILLDLESGNVIDLIYGYAIHSVYLDGIILDRIVSDYPLFQEDAFESMNNRDYDSYEDYLEWYKLNCNLRQEMAFYTISNEELKMVLEIPIIAYEGDSGMLEYDISQTCLCYYDNKLFFSKRSSDIVDIYSINVNSLEVGPVYSFSKGGILISGMVDCNCMVDNGIIRYILYDEAKEYGRVCSLDLATGATKELYTDVWNIKYRLNGETDDSFLMDLDDGYLYKILKIDYYTGEFSNMKKYSIDK